MNPCPRDARAMVALGRTRSLTDVSRTPRDPNREAMRHRHRGAWLSWSHEAVAAHVERLAANLRGHGVGAGSVVAVSGDFTPNLVLVAAAATRLGALVTPLPPAIVPAELTAWLQGEAPASPALVFLGSREPLNVWRAALRDAGCSSDVVVDFQLPWGQSAGDDFIQAAELLGEFEHAATPATPGRDVLWIEEGTEWTEGLSYILWAVAEGRPLAFPEGRSAANRDRATVQPTAFALSPDRHAALVDELGARLPGGGTVAARLTRWALAAGREARERWYHAPLLRSLRRPFGLAGLRELVVAGPRGPSAAPEAGDLLRALGIVVGHAVVPVHAASPAPAKIVFA